MTLKFDDLRATWAPLVPQVRLLTPGGLRRRDRKPASSPDMECGFLKTIHDTESPSPSGTW